MQLTRDRSNNPFIQLDPHCLHASQQNVHGCYNSANHSLILDEFFLTVTSLSNVYQIVVLFTKIAI